MKKIKAKFLEALDEETAIELAIENECVVAYS